jgi:iron complex outermembrane receptor protein
MDASRVRVLEDGTSSSDASDIGPDHGVPIDPLSSRSIEVVRGAATLRYGSQAIGGVVNAINNRIPLTLPGAPSGEVSTAFDSVSDAGQVALLGDIAAGNFAIHADGFYRGTGDYDTPLGKQTNSFFKGDGVSLGSSYFFGEESRIGAAVVHYDSKYGVPATRRLSTCGRPNICSGRRWRWRWPVPDPEHQWQLWTLCASRARPGRHRQRHLPQQGTGPARRDAAGRHRPPVQRAVGVEVQNRQFAAAGDGADYLLPTITRTMPALSSPKRR